MIMVEHPADPAEVALAATLKQRLGEFSSYVENNTFLQFIHFFSNFAIIILLFLIVSSSYPHKDAQIEIILQAFKAFISSRALEQCSVI